MHATPLFFLIALLLISCNTQTPDFEELKAEIKELHLATYASINDSTVGNLYTAANLLEQSPALPDDLRAYNDHLLGFYHRYYGTVDSASFYFNRTISYVNDTIPKGDRRALSFFKGAWDTFALENKYGDCLAVAKKMERYVQPTDTLLLALMNFFYAEAYFQSGEYQQANNYNTRQTEQWQALGDSTALANSLILQVRINDVLQVNPQETEKLLQTLVDSESSLTDNMNQQVYSNYGIFLYYQDHFDAARANYQKSLEYVKKTADSPNKTEDLSISYSNLAEVSMDLGDYGSAELYLDSVQGLGLNRIPTRITKSYLKYRYRLAAETNKSPKEITVLIDSVTNFLARDYQEKYSKELVALTTAYEKEKELLAQQQLAEIKNIKLQTRMFLILAVALLLVAVGLLLYRQRKLRFERAGLQMQQRLLRSQMNPHFTFNTLYAIQRQIKETPQLAQEYLLKFSRLLRLILENSMENYVLLENELESLRKYMDLQLIRFPEKFSYEIKLDGLEEDDPVYIPPMLIQPFVENAIEHGFSGINYRGNLLITLTDKNKFLYCSIVDNGSGVIHKESKNKKSASTQLISDFLTKVTGEGISIKKLSNSNNKPGGIEVTFLIPVKAYGSD